MSELSFECYMATKKITTTLQYYAIAVCFTNRINKVLILLIFFHDLTCKKNRGQLQRLVA